MRGTNQAVVLHTSMRQPTPVKARLLLNLAVMVILRISMRFGRIRLTCMVSALVGDAI
jgi:hypothetical protein